MYSTEPIDLKSARWKHTLDSHITREPPPSTRSLIKRYAQTPWCQGVTLFVFSVVALALVAPPITRTHNPRKPLERGHTSALRVFSVALLLSLAFLLCVCLVPM